MLIPFCNQCKKQITEGMAERCLAFVGDKPVHQGSKRNLARLTLHPWDEETAKSSQAIHLCGFICRAYFIQDWTWKITPAKESAEPEESPDAVVEPATQEAAI